ncbi:GNAT family N-acetyltransferase [Actinoplanes aureus]|uniref:GNAT family N-acetyltransferase n=1 Tax=Actinoplanes aureus TaxID=2792083 RepID=A0A931G1L1_9ACTN|nr:GNAT family N-acetyltransferase [Actinoplanes aureus]MBG0566802.1 GNAT family N-acetyltransferase [Actinoplanes aureus]
MEIRPAVPADAAAVVALRASVYPYLVRGEHATRRMIASPPPGEDWAAFVAEAGAEVAGWVSAYRNPRSGLGQISLLHVHPGHRRRGIGAALFAAAAGHLRGIGVTRVAGTTTVEALGFARRYGFEPTRELRYSALDLATLGSPAPPVPDGIRLVPLRDVHEDALYQADVAAATDEPGDVPGEPTPYSTWRYEIWENDSLDRDASTAALAGSEIVSFSLLARDGDRAWSDMTATVPAWRGRGLARAVKTEALHRAAASGVRTAYTSNDESNAPMLAVNVRLGYRPVARQLACLAGM